jgi:crossover junction endodeoxyribonuclease RuvC
VLILGVDPGSQHTGYGLIRKDGPDLAVVAVGTLSPPARAPLPARLAHLGREMEALAERWNPDQAVLESPFAGMNARSLIVLAQARGVLIAALARYEVEILEFTPAQVKKAVAGNGRAGKQQVARMVRLLLSFQDECSEDATDALAVAVCCAQRLRMDRISAVHGARK